MSGRIRVVSKRRGGLPARQDETVIDGDRTHPVLGNPFVLSDHRNEDERAYVIRRHRQEIFEPDMLAKGPIFQLMQDLATRAAQGENIALRCWCSPAECHLDHVADGIKRLVAGEDLQATIRARRAAREQLLMAADHAVAEVRDMTDAALIAALEEVDDVLGSAAFKA